VTPGRPARARRPGGAALAAAARGLGPLAVLTGALLTFPGCAPRPGAPAEVSADLVRSRFAAALAERDRRGRAADAEVTIWARTNRPWPAASGFVFLAGPDTVRLRLDSAFGTALDGAARGDSLRARLPARRLALAADARRDGMGIDRPGRLLYQLLAADWRPSPEAWGRAERAPGGLTTRWSEHGDSLALAVGGEGLPRELELALARGTRVRVRYTAWRGRGREAWPARIEIVERRWSARFQIERTRFHDEPVPGRLVVRAAAGDRTLGWEEFRRTLADEEAPQ